MKAKLTSRKFWITVVTGLLVLANQAFELGLDEAAIGQFVTVVAAFVVGQGIADHGSQGKALNE